ncbi:hypothetical protein RNZ50_20245 [Paracoccaceae bacterium Fryx2]|nr:hypothetical protein [Paracoccaceae bacterium Fryx2]
MASFSGKSRRRRRPGDMLIGLVLSGILSGLAGLAWAVMQGHPLPVILAFYPLAGFCGTASFVLVVLWLGGRAETRSHVGVQGQG